MTDDVFTDDPNQTGEGEQRKIENYLQELVGEDKKFKSHEDLAKGKWEADAYIDTLTRQMDNMRLELDKRKTADEIADQIRKELANRGSSNPDDNNSQDENDADNKGNDQNKTEGLSQEDLVKLLDKRLNERESQTKAQQNRLEVSNTLREKIGSTAGKWLKDKAEELGVTSEYLQQQAEVSPKAFYNLVGLNQGNSTQQRQTGFTPPSSTVRVPDSGTILRTDSWYRKQFQQNPSLRFDPKTTVQMHEDAMKLGEKFFD